MNRIQDVLATKNKTQIWLAEQMQGREGAVTLRTLSDYCTNQQQPRLDTLALIAEVLGVSVRSLIGDGSEITD